MKIVAFIPAEVKKRNKNIRQLGEIPLIAIVFTSEMVDEIDRIIVSTDSEEYALIAKESVKFL